MVLKDSNYVLIFGAYIRLIAESFHRGNAQNELPFNIRYKEGIVQQRRTISLALCERFFAGDPRREALLKPVLTDGGITVRVQPNDAKRVLLKCHEAVHLGSKFSSRFSWYRFVNLATEL